MEKKEAILKEYVKGNKLAIEQIVEEYYSYVNKILRNAKSIYIQEEDVEEMISDIFLALWRNYQTLEKTIRIKPYLAGIARNILKNKYRITTTNVSITDYEEKLASFINLEEIIEEKEQNQIVQRVLKTLKGEEYQAFIAFYYEGKKIKDIAKQLEISESKAKVILYRIRKQIKRKLKIGGYRYGK